MGFGLDLRIGNARCTIGDRGGAAIAVVDRDQLGDPVQLDRSGEIFPKCWPPSLETWRHDRDRGAGNDKLTVFAGQAPLIHVFVDG